MTNTTRRALFLLLGCGLAAAPLPAAGPAPAAPPDSARVGHGRDGQRDFDFSIGTWKTRMRRLVHPLTGSSTWVGYEGTSVVRSAWNGRANLVELDASGPAGRIEGLSLRLYNPEARQWSLNYANSRLGTLTAPVVGEFRGGRGEFFGQEMVGGRTVLARFVVSEESTDSWRYEQAFSDDGGRTWEVNWIAVDTRVKEEAP